MRFDAIDEPSLAEFGRALSEPTAALSASGLLSQRSGASLPDGLRHAGDVLRSRTIQKTYTAGAVLKPAGLGWSVFLLPCWAAPCCDPVFQTDAFQARSAPSVEIWLPTAARTFFEGRGGYCSYGKLRVCRPRCRGINARGTSRVLIPGDCPSFYGVVIPPKKRLGVSCFCFWRLLNCAGWPRRTPFGDAEESPIAFICELTKQVRFGLVVFGERKPAISDRTSVAHGHFKSQRNITRIQAQEKDLVPSPAGSGQGPRDKLDLL